MFIPFFGPPLALLPIIFVALAFRPEVALLISVILVVTHTVLVKAIHPRLLQREVGSPSHPRGRRPPRRLAGPTDARDQGLDRVHRLVNAVEVLGLLWPS